MVILTKRKLIYRHYDNTETEISFWQKRKYHHFDKKENENIAILTKNGNRYIVIEKKRKRKFRHFHKHQRLHRFSAPCLPKSFLYLTLRSTPSLVMVNCWTTRERLWTTRVNQALWQGFMWVQCKKIWKSLYWSQVQVTFSVTVTSDAFRSFAPNKTTFQWILKLPGVKAVAGEYHGCGWHSKHNCLQDRANFYRSWAWQIVLIFNTLSRSYHHNRV